MNQTNVDNTENVIKFSHLSDITTLQFNDAEDDRKVWLQYLPLGTYEHPTHGEIKIDSQRVKRFVANFKRRVREQDLDIDYDHKILDTKAAGWITDAEDRDEAGLWVQVDFTEPAYQSLKKKEFKYFSAEFADSWTHPKTSQTFIDVMFGGAITNRPFIKDILPINLSEFVGENFTESVGSMDPKLKASLVKLYKLSEDATDEEVLEAVETAAETPEVTTEEPTAEEVTEETPSEEEIQLSELAKTNPAIKVLLAEREESRSRMAALEMANRLSETTVKLAQLNENGKFAIPPALSDKARDIIVSLPVKQGNAVLDLVGDFAQVGLVELGERGKRNPNDDNVSLAEQFTASVAKFAEERKISFAEAALAVAASDSNGFAAYRSASTN
jgi:phage I-like protein